MASRFIANGDKLGGTSRGFLAVKSAEVDVRRPRWLHAASGLL